MTDETSGADIDQDRELTEEQFNQLLQALNEYADMADSSGCDDPEHIRGVEDVVRSQSELRYRIPNGIMKAGARPALDLFDHRHGTNLIQELDVDEPEHSAVTCGCGSTSVPTIDSPRCRDCGNLLVQDGGDGA